MKRKPHDPRRCCDQPHKVLQRTLNRVKEMAFYNAIDLDNWKFKQARLTAPHTYEWLDKKWRTIRLGDDWGGRDVTGFFQREVVVPADLAGQDVMLDIFLDGGEAQLTVNGHPWQGLDWNRSLVPLKVPARKGDRFKLEIEAFVINYPYDGWRNDERDQHIFKRARLVCRDKELEEFYRDAQLAMDVYINYWETDANIELERLILTSLQIACKGIDLYEPDRLVLRKQVKVARRLLRQLLYDNPAFRHDGRVSLCANSHLDIIYLWPIKETFRKNCRTATNMLSLMREFPDYKFTQSQPFMYEALQEMYPAVHEEIKKMVKAGRWEVIGGMYVEPDGNLPGAESFVRQILFGKRFFRKEFGVDTLTCWMPDVFGAIYTLPQILKKAGLKYFTTIKLNTWNDTNEFPYSTFWWQGLDGSRVLTHFPPTHFGELYEPKILRRHWQDFLQKEELHESLMLYGWADGGGGPTREMVAASLRTASFPGLPSTKIEFAEDYLNRIAKKADALPVWDSELYLEAHRGTLTTRGDLKKRNRQAEILYRDAEILSSTAYALGAPSARDEINTGWKKVLLNQFHDTLPGTHVKECGPDIDQDYRDIFAIGEKVRQAAIGHITQSIDADGGLCLFNTLSWKRDDLVTLAGPRSVGSVCSADSQHWPVQHYDNQLWFFAKDLPPLGWTTVALEPGRADGTPTAEFKGHRLETPFYTIQFTGDGCLKSIHDKLHNREVLAAGKGNEFQVFEDNPGRQFSGWDILETFENRRWDAQQSAPWKLIANGPVLAVLRAEWTVLNSHIRQDLIVYHDLGRIDFKTTANWQDSERLLKVAFPLAVHTRQAAYDLPFGHMERPTHRNTSWEQAQFEVCGHKWADLSEGDYGVALLNDCKYGYDARENRLRLSLLRSPVRPHPTSDLGRHEFTYSLLPHGGGWRQAHVDRRAYEFNIPVLTAALPAKPTRRTVSATYSLLATDSNSVIVEAIKQAEDTGDLVIRAFDSLGCRGEVSFAVTPALKRVKQSNLIEEEEQAVVRSAAHAFTDVIQPYEIKTYKIRV